MRYSLKKIIQVTLLALCLHNPVLAEDENTNFLSGEFGLGYTSRYIWRSVDLYSDDNPGINASVLFNLGDTGLYTGIWGMIPYDDDNRSYQEVDWYGGFANSVFEDKLYALNYDLSYVYYDFYLADKATDFQEVILKLELPSIQEFLKLPITPYGSISYAWPATNKGYENGFWYSVGLLGNIPTPQSVLTQDEQTLDVYTETYYTDSGAPFNIDPGFTHATFGLRTTWNISSVGITPGIHYSWNWEDTANTENEFWADIALVVPF